MMAAGMGKIDRYIYLLYIYGRWQWLGWMNDGIRGMEKVEARMTFVFPACMTRFTEMGTNREDQT